jgi:hypothetical protein
VLALSLAKWVEGNQGLCREITSDDASKKTWTLEKGSKTFPSFFSKVPFIYLFYFFYFMICNDGKQKHAMEKE